MPAATAIADVTVEFEDVDVLGIVHHARQVCYLERARARLLAALGLRIDGAEVMPVVHELHVRFQEPVRFGEQLRVSVWVEDADVVVRLGYRITRGRRTVARAWTTIAFYDRAAGRVCPTPEAWLAALATGAA